ncbi:MAG: hypothetical protein KAR20_09700, partial [Candidatus Heimdallarchaeota archaeon]|nr:hypothetical protein [Candidatus Heimdallarchaeota archaeon]
LAKLYKKSKNEDLIQPLVKAVEFAWYFMHPDGSYGGEYGSRNTYHFYPDGFEIMAQFTDKASQIADHFLRSIPRHKRYYNDDDRMVAQYVSNWLQAYEDYYHERPLNINERDNFLKWFPDAKIAVCKTDIYYAVTNMTKGGVIKIFDTENVLASDTGLIGRLHNGTVLVTHLIDEQNIIGADQESGEFKVQGSFAKRSDMLPTPFRQVVFRIFLLLLGRFSANLVRFILQKMLVTRKKRTGYKFERTIRFKDKKVEIEDRLLDKIPEFKQVSVGSDATSIYVPNSNVYQESVLCEWHNASEQEREILKKGKPWIRKIEKR